MPAKRGFLIVFSATAVLCAQDAPRKQLTARELFYAATKPAPPKPDAPKAVAKAPTAPPRSTKTPPKPVEIAVAQPSMQPPRPAPTPDGSAQVVRTAAQTAPMPANGEPPLGLRINVLRFNPDGTTTDVLPDTIFHSGDRIQLAIETNGRGFLYIASQGASGTWRPMFPAPEIANGDNRVEPMRPYTMPPYNTEAAKPRVYTFDATAGKEKLFVVFSRTPVPDFDELIYSLGNSRKAAEKPEEPARTDKTLIMAANIGDPTISRMRDTYARDLIIETVSAAAPAAPGDKKDTAIYVVNPTGSSDSRVVADIQLVHQ